MNRLRRAVPASDPRREGDAGESAASATCLAAKTTDETLRLVIPAQAGIQFFARVLPGQRHELTKIWIPAYAGKTGISSNVAAAAATAPEKHRADG